jgi:N-acetylmuramoyl-L-alanine amidase
VAGASPVPANWNVVVHEGRRYVPIEDVATFYRLGRPVKSDSSFLITGRGKTIRSKPGTREVFINNVKYILCFPIVRRGNTHFFSAMDVTKIIEPVMRPEKIAKSRPFRTVILDAGHGGHDSGAKGPRGVEKEAALDVVLRAKRLLEQKGYKVLLTRSRDVFIPLGDRSKFANRHPDAIFVSVHFNKSRNPGASGIETFALAPRGVPSMGDDGLKPNALRQYPGHKRDAENIALATAMHSSMLRHMKLFDRGIKRARFHVIRETSIPSVLLEGGFMNHRVDSRLIAGSTYRDAFARAIVEGVGRYRLAISGTVPERASPSAIASGADPSAIPAARRRFSPIGINTTLNEAVQRAAEALRGGNAVNQGDDGD